MRESIKLQKKKYLKNVVAAGIMAGVMSVSGISAYAEEAPVQPQETAMQALDYESQLLLKAQMQIAAQGINLQKYHVINILGDSLTEGVGARTPDKAYPVVISKLTGAKVNNYGLSCSRITDINSTVSNPPSFIDRMYGMDKSADLIIIFGGTNDFWYGDCPIGRRTDTGVGTFYGALNTMMTYLKNTYPNADIMFVTPYQQSKDADINKPYQRSTYCNYGTGTLSDYRKALLDRCQFHNIPVLDLYADYELNTVDNRAALEMYGNYLCDGCHLNNLGYNLLARKMYNFFMQDMKMAVPVYVEFNNMVFESAALPALITPNGFMLPNNQVLPFVSGFEANANMSLQQIYQSFRVSAASVSV